MNLTLLPCGDRALLAQVADVDAVLALTAALLADPECSAAIAELVPAAVTVLIEAHDGSDLQELAAAVSAVAEATDAADTAARDGDEVRIPVRYDGPDLADVAAATGLTADEVIARHSGSVWRAAFGGFSPGFAYLVGGPSEWDVPRRNESRTAVPAGSVGLAGGYSAVYPSESPGGWQLIGTTDTNLWDVDRDPPAVIRPGTLVRFVDVDADRRKVAER
jgi:KipI family sensor histidine kinase inhibitor